MTNLPQDIKEKFYKTIASDISANDFEQWLYEDKELEKYLNVNDYLELISFSFKQDEVEYEFCKLLKKHIDLGEFETYKILALLNEAKQKTERLAYILMKFYDLYCGGYSFLQDLGVAFGSAVEVVNAWEKLTKEQQQKLLDSFSPDLEEYIEKVIYWLETKRIILTGGSICNWSLQL